MSSAPGAGTACPLSDPGQSSEELVARINRLELQNQVLQDDLAASHKSLAASDERERAQAAVILRLPDAQRRLFDPSDNMDTTDENMADGGEEEVASQEYFDTYCNALATNGIPSAGAVAPQG